MSDSAKQALVIIGLIIVVGTLTMPIFKRKEKIKETKKLNKPAAGQAQDELREAALVCMCAYIEALNNNEPPKVLEELNNQFYNEYGMSLHCKDDGEIYDLTVYQDGTNVAEFQSKMS